MTTFLLFVVFVVVVFVAVKYTDRATDAAVDPIAKHLDVRARRYREQFGRRHAGDASLARWLKIIAGVMAAVMIVVLASASSVASFLGALVGLTACGFLFDLGVGISEVSGEPTSGASLRRAFSEVREHAASAEASRVAPVEPQATTCLRCGGGVEASDYLCMTCGLRPRPGMPPDLEPLAQKLKAEWRATQPEAYAEWVRSSA